MDIVIFIGVLLVITLVGILALLDEWQEADRRRRMKYYERYLDRCRRSRRGE
jgi:hypothetical protein